MIGKDPTVFNLTFDNSFSSPDIFRQKVEIISPVKPVFEMIKKHGHKRIIHIGYEHSIKLI